MTESIYKRKKVTVWNLSNDDKSIYKDICPFDALINESILREVGALQLHNTLTRDKYRNRIILGRVSASIGDLAVSLNEIHERHIK